MQDFLRKNIRYLRQQYGKTAPPQRSDWTNSIAQLPPPVKIQRSIRCNTALQAPVVHGRQRVFEFHKISGSMAIPEASQLQPGYKMVTDANESMHETVPADYEEFGGCEALVFSLQLPLQKMVVVSKPTYYLEDIWTTPVAQTPREAVRPKPPFSAVRNIAMGLREPFSPQYHLCRPVMLETPGTLEHLPVNTSLLDDAPLEAFGSAAVM